MGKYFTIAELTRSEKAKVLKIDNIPPPVIKVSLECLIGNLLDPIREVYGKPIQVNSGFRCPVLNKAVGGAASSQHVRGEAADITVGDPKDNKKLFDLIIKSDLVFDQLIDEKNYQWLHLSLKSKNNRNQILHI